jgi:hypothetical protein
MVGHILLRVLCLLSLMAASYYPRHYLDNLKSYYVIDVNHRQYLTVHMIREYNLVLHAQGVLEEEASEVPHHSSEQRHPHLVIRVGRLGLGGGGHTDQRET